MPVRIVEEDCPERVVTIRQAFDCVHDDVDPGEFATAILTRLPFRQRTRDDRMATFCLIPDGLLPAPEDIPLEPTRHPDAVVWVCEATLYVPLDVTCLCPASSEEEAENLITDAMCGSPPLWKPDPDFQVIVSQDNILQFKEHLEKARLPHDFGAAQIAIHSIAQQYLLGFQS